MGDALDKPYPTLSASTGASHLVTAMGPRLGTLVDVEMDGQPSAYADGDDQLGLADEDGVLHHAAAAGPARVRRWTVDPPASSACWMADRFRRRRRLVARPAWPGSHRSRWAWASPRQPLLQCSGCGSRRLHLRAVPASARRAACRRPAPRPTARRTTGSGSRRSSGPSHRCAWTPTRPPTGPGTPSLYQGKQIVADDWRCEDARPVTDIHWWGSYLEEEQAPPQPTPVALHIGISDRRAGHPRAFQPSRRHDLGMDRALSLEVHERAAGLVTSIPA